MHKVCWFQRCKAFFVAIHWCACRTCGNLNKSCSALSPISIFKDTMYVKCYISHSLFFNSERGKSKSWFLCSPPVELVVKAPELATPPRTPRNPPLLPLPPLTQSPASERFGLLRPRSFFHYEFICLQKKEAAGATWNPGALHQGL